MQRYSTNLIKLAFFQILSWRHHLLTKPTPPKICHGPSRHGITFIWRLASYNQLGNFNVPWCSWGKAGWIVKSTKVFTYESLKTTSTTTIRRTRTTTTKNQPPKSVQLTKIWNALLDWLSSRNLWNHALRPESLVRWSSVGSETAYKVGLVINGVVTTINGLWVSQIGSYCFSN